MRNNTLEIQGVPQDKIQNVHELLKTVDTDFYATMVEEDIVLKKDMVGTV